MASVSSSQSVTPTVSAGWVSAGTAGTVTASGSITITATGITTVRLAEYDSNHQFIQREYVTDTSATFTLNASTAYVRIGFKYASAQSEETVTALFNGGYTVSN